MFSKLPIKITKHGKVVCKYFANAILNISLVVKGGKMWTGCNWLRTEISGGLL
jgi:hypothetical protein